MRSSTLLSTLFLLLPVTLASTVSEPPQQPLNPEKTHTLDLYTQPLNAANAPSHLAKISYTYPSLNASVEAYTPPSALSTSDSDTILKLGFYSPSTQTSENWHGIATSRSLFSRTQKKTLRLHLDTEGKVWHLGFSATAKEDLAPKEKGTKAKAKGAKASDEANEELAIILVPSKPGPKVQVNKPIVVNKETGKPEGEGEEKTFLQKYWWAIALFLVVQVVMGGSGDK